MSHPTGWPPARRTTNDPIGDVGQPAHREHERQREGRDVERRRVIRRQRAEPHRRQHSDGEDPQQGQLQRPTSTVQARRSTCPPASGVRLATPLPRRVRLRQLCGPPASAARASSSNRRRHATRPPPHHRPADPSDHRSPPRRHRPRGGDARAGHARDQRFCRRHLDTYAPTAETVPDRNVRRCAAGWRTWTIRSRRTGTARCCSSATASSHRRGRTRRGTRPIPSPPVPCCRRATPSPGRRTPRPASPSRTRCAISATCSTCSVSRSASRPARSRGASRSAACSPPPCSSARRSASTAAWRCAASLAGSVGLWNSYLDGLFVLRTFLDAEVDLVHIGDPFAAIDTIRAALRGRPADAAGPGPHRPGRRRRRRPRLDRRRQPAARPGQRRHPGGRAVPALPDAAAVRPRRCAPTWRPRRRQPVVERRRRLRRSAAALERPPRGA